MHRFWPKFPYDWKHIIAFVWFQQFKSDLYDIIGLRNAHVPSNK